MIAEDLARQREEVRAVDRHDGGRIRVSQQEVLVGGAMSAVPYEIGECVGGIGGKQINDIRSSARNVLESDIKEVS